MARLIDLYPLQGMFKPGQMCRFCVVVGADEVFEGQIRLHIYHFESVMARVSQRISMLPGEQAFKLFWLPTQEGCHGYGIAAELLDEEGQLVGTASSAFDVLEAWTCFPRYALVRDFSPGRVDIVETIEKLLRFHINGLQFQNWQYRYESLLPPTETYLDPLGREHSRAAVRVFIGAAHQYGMAAMAYLAAHAASLSFQREHPGWALYDDQGRPISFMDYLGLMDPTAGRPWSAHLIKEWAELLAALPFDGLHLAQVGDAKEAFDVNGAPVELAQAFSLFIHSLKGALAETAVAITTAGNWPNVPLASAPHDFITIEVRPPAISYYDLVDIILNARQKSGGKTIAIALTLPAQRTANVRLADGLIFSSGGARIELEEGDRLLSEPHFRNQQKISPELEKDLRRYHDFAIRYQELFGPSAGMGGSLATNLPDGIWQMARNSPGRMTLCLVNMIGVEDRDWNKDHSAPTPQRDVSVRIAIDRPIAQVYWSSPDGQDLRLLPVPWRVGEPIIEVAVPELAYWGILVFVFGVEDKG